MAQSMHDVSDPRNASILINVNGELKPRPRRWSRCSIAGSCSATEFGRACGSIKGRLAFLDRHLDRLFEGAKAIAMDIGLSRDS